jgi:putative ABC transport system permease protein
MIRSGMLLWSVRSGLKNISRHGLRSSLTVLGVVFGVGSVIAMLAVGEGASQEALEQIRRLGSTTILINAARPAESRARSGGRSFMSVYGLLYQDRERIVETFPGVRRAVPAKILRKEGRKGGRSVDLRVVGTTPEWFEVLDRRLVAGRRLLPRDLQERKNVVVLAEPVARLLLAMGSGIGEIVRIGGGSFEVVGIVKSEGARTGEIRFPDQDIDAYIPLTVARERYGDVFVRRTSGTRVRELVELHQIIVEARSQEDVEPVAAGIVAMFERFHKRRDWDMHVPLTLLRQAEATKRTFRIVLGSIAGISLLVGGIGIMNIMLASVTERTREIGIRRAVGAKRRQIVGQFLVETVVLSTAGGVNGILLGLLIPWVITRFAGLPTVVTPLSILVSLGISMAVGVVFGLYPAVRAAALDPIEALRHG